MLKMLIWPDRSTCNLDYEINVQSGHKHCHPPYGSGQNYRTPYTEIRGC